jgi:hypothetical protein
MFKNSFFFTFLFLLINFNLSAQENLPKDEQVLLERYIREIYSLAKEKDNNIHKDFAINLNKDAEGILSKDSFYRFKAYSMYMADKVSNFGDQKADKDVPKTYDAETEDLINTSYSTYVDRIKNPVENTFVSHNEQAIRLEDEKEEDIFPFSIVHKIPVFKGCKKSLSREDKRKCTTVKITAYVEENFNLKLIEDLQISQSQHIYVRFLINKKGLVKDVSVRSPHPKLSQEAKRVVESFPKMKPGKDKNNKPVVVIYNLPITLSVN